MKWGFVIVLVFSLRCAGQATGQRTDTVLQLESVIVNGRKPLYEQKPDRMVIHVQSSITFAGSSVLEILERSPGVDVNRQNNVITMNGKD